jgi:predicted nucleic acid-binding Zn ribbon protein
MKKMDRAGNILERVLKSLELGQKMAEVRALSVWPEAAGPRVAANTRAVSVVRGRMLVETKSPVWAQECLLLKERIREKLNRLVGSEAVKDITFKVGSFTESGMNQKPDTK